MEIQITNNEKWLKKIEHLKNCCVTNGELERAEVYEKDIGETGVAAAEKVFESITENYDESLSYFRLVFFTSNLLYVEGLLDRFLNLDSDVRKLFWRRFIQDPDIINGCIMAYSETNLKGLSTTTQYYDNRSAARVYESLDEDILNNELSSISDSFYEIAEKFTKGTRDSTTSREFIFASLLMLRLTYNEETLIEVMKRWMNESPSYLLTEFVLTLKNWQKLKEYPLDWTVTIASFS